MKKALCLKSKRKGVMMPQVLVFAAISISLITALVGWAATNIQASRQSFYREQAFEIAEAGIEYYRWHLAHADTDFQDGTGAPGPYVHVFNDKNGNAIGSFTLDIIPPPSGSTIVTVRSKGVVDAYPSVYRRVEVKFAKPSLAKYAAVSNSQLFYGSGDNVAGPVHSNSGVIFISGAPNAYAFNTVTSALTTFNDPYHAGANEFAVHTHIAPTDPLPPSAIPSRLDVFGGGRQVSVPVVDFAGITEDISNIKTAAQTTGFYRAASGGVGYLVVLKTDDTFDLYKVNSLLPPPGTGLGICADAKAGNPPNWGTWSVGTVAGAKTLLGNYAIPANGLVFLEDHTWVEGTINSARLTIAAGTFPDNPATRKNIIVNNNLTYTNTDAQDVIALIAQNNFLIGLASANNLRIDAAIVAQSGATFRHYYRPPSGGRNYCGPFHTRASLTTFGMYASNGQAYFLQGGGFGNSGFLSQPASYDANLLYSPPPSFPLTSDQYQTLYWQEIK